MRFLPFISALLLAAGAFTACDAHDYWLLTDIIQVNSDDKILISSNTEPLSQELYVRYQLDYQVENLSSQDTEVIVSATSFVNDIERATDQKIWQLAPSETGEGILTTSQLQLGNSLVVSLKCCSRSQCTRKDAICPSSLDKLPSTDELAAFCYDSCADTTSCLRQCPSERGCEAHCKTAQNIEKCRKDYCEYGGSAASCNFLCTNNEDCYSTCNPTPECADKCQSLKATCFRNCISTWNQCTGESYHSDADLIPCSLCNGQGACKLNPEQPKTENDPHTLTSTDGKVYTCDLNCNTYPSQCVTGCDNLYEDDTTRLECLAACLDQHLYWCNDFIVPDDYIDTQGKQPCCFSNYCNHALTGVVKTYDVQCFNDTSCSAGQSCSPEGICVSSGSSGCSSNPVAPKPSIFLIFLTAACVAWRRRRGQHA